YFSLDSRLENISGMACEKLAGWRDMRFDFQTLSLPTGTASRHHPITRHRVLSFVLYPCQPETASLHNCITA
ncbi:MAG: hypothetical protein WBN28_03220, partial [Lutimonas sp.]